MPNSNKVTKIIANVFTSLNIACGSIAVFLAIEGKQSLLMASYLVFISVLMAFIGGIFTSKSEIPIDFRKQFALLSDIISFGLAPTAIMYELLKQAARVSTTVMNTPLNSFLILSSSLLIVIFAGIRLSRSFTGLKNKEFFSGLPSAANAMMIASIPLTKEMIPEDFPIYSLLHDWTGYDFPLTASIGLIGLQVFVLERTYVLIPLMIIFCILMSVKLPMITFRFENFKYSDNRTRYNLIIVSVILFLFLYAIAVPVILFIYMLIGILQLRSDRVSHIKAKRHLDRLFAEKSAQAL